MTNSLQFSTPLKFQFSPFLIRNEWVEQIVSIPIPNSSQACPLNLWICVNVCFASFASPTKWPTQHQIAPTVRAPSGQMQIFASFGLQRRPSSPNTSKLCLSPFPIAHILGPCADNAQTAKQHTKGSATFGPSTLRTDKLWACPEQLGGGTQGQTGQITQILQGGFSKMETSLVWAESVF